MRAYYDDPDHPERRAKKKEKDLEAYYNDRERVLETRKTYYQNNREARKAQVAEYQMLKKIKAVSVLGGKCFRCGEDHPAALQFHHRDPSTKLFNITTKQLASPKKFPWDTVILPEIEKCDLLCANCHFKHHCVWSLPE
jgi:hypothetical protein